MLDKITSILLLLFITIITTEVVYNHFQQISIAPNNVSSQNTDSATNYQSNDSWADKLIHRVQIPIQMIQKDGSDYAMNPIILDALMLTSKYVKKDVLKSAIYSVIVEGEITEILNIDKTTYNKSNTIPRIYIVIKGNRGSFHQLGIPQEDNTQTTLMNVYTKNKERISITDLKYGDKIRVKVDMNLTNSNNGKMINNWTVDLL